MRRTMAVSTVLLMAVSMGVLSLQAGGSGGKMRNQALPGGAAETREGEGVRIKKFPVAVQCWTFRRFSFFQTLDKVKSLGIRYLQPYPGQKMGAEMPGIRFDHNLTDEQVNKIRQRLEDDGLSLVGYGVVIFANDEEEMDRIFAFARRMGTRTIVTEPEFDGFSGLERMVKKYGVQVAIHNHPEPAKYARPETVLSRVQGLDDRIGACADTGHWMRSGIDPVEAIRMLRGRVLDVHLKDLNVFGQKDARDVPFGQGRAGIRAILAELTLQNFGGFLTVEHENTDDADNPSPPILEGLEYIRSITYYEGYEEILKRTGGRYSKQGWNHYGPGHFTLDEKSGVLKGHGGMGLFWYGAEKYRDFILELDYRCEDEFTNSGIFLRVPEVPASDDYIYHSFEVQINDAGEGVHKTGAVYDAEAPVADAAKPAGEWNHIRITFQGRLIRVELNGVLVVDWKAEPRGKVKDFASEGYIGLQNHDSRSPVYFRNIFVKKL